MRNRFCSVSSATRRNKVCKQKEAIERKVDVNFGVCINSKMSNLRANALLYINMAGEMVYVVHQRLKAQRIAVEKSVRVLDEVSGAVLKSALTLKLFEESNAGPIDLVGIRSALEKALLSSIMRLDESSTTKLFELATMMVKYQMTAATGPRELLLLTLNHLDFMRTTLVDPCRRQAHEIVHRALIQLYGNMTNGEMWKVREACLDRLSICKVRVSVLLRMGLQNVGGTFNIPSPRDYDEEYRDEFANFKLSDVFNSGNSNVGSFELFGDRVTSLGTSIYLSTHASSETQEKKDEKGTVSSGRSKGSRERSLLKKRGNRAELGMLAVQLGASNESEFSSDALESDDNTGPLILQLFDSNTELKSQNEEFLMLKKEKEFAETIEPRYDDDYTAKLNDIRAELVIDVETSDVSVAGRMRVLELMDELE